MMEYDIISSASTYQYFSGQVLFHFGHGLSYSNFEYSLLAIDKAEAGEGETVRISFKIKNTGSVEAEEVPQMYVAFSGSVFRRPLKSLKGFTRLGIRPDEEQVVHFSLPVKELAVWDSFHNHFCVETGHCMVMIGASSADIRLSSSFKVCGKNVFPRKIPDHIYAQRFDEYSGCFLHEKRGNAIPAVFNKSEGGWIRFAALDFADGCGLISAVVQGAPGSRIEIRLDTPDGALAGTLAVPNTGDISFYPLTEKNSPRRRPVWAYAETPMEKISGVHDLYLVFFGKTGLWQIDIK
jgi:beta-glucosidase